MQLARVTDRLVRAVALDLGAPDETTDVGPLLEDVRRRWSGVVDREVVVDSRVRTVPVNGERLRAALDTLVENAVRYTVTGDRICLFSAVGRGSRRGGRRRLRGPGCPTSSSSASSPRPTRRTTSVDTSVGAEAAAQRLRDLYSRTGFGLRLVAGIARTAGGRIVASRSAYGGARVALSIPVPRGARRHPGAGRAPASSALPHQQ